MLGFHRWVRSIFQVCRGELCETGERVTKDSKEPICNCTPGSLCLPNARWNSYTLSYLRKGFQFLLMNWRLSKNTRHRKREGYDVISLTTLIFFHNFKSLIIVLIISCWLNILNMFVWEFLFLFYSRVFVIFQQCDVIESQHPFCGGWQRKSRSYHRDWRI